MGEGGGDIGVGEMGCADSEGGEREGQRGGGGLTVPYRHVERVPTLLGPLANANGRAQELVERFDKVCKS